jgi:hypothetical protein
MTAAVTGPGSASGASGPGRYGYLGSSSSAVPPMSLVIKSMKELHVRLQLIILKSTASCDRHAIQKANAEQELQRLEERMELVEEIRHQHQTLLQQQQQSARLAAQEAKRASLLRKVQESSQILDFFEILQRGSQQQ